MSKAKHTPGPWEIWGPADPYQVIASKGGPFVAQTVGGNDAANALLIASAPELLEALQAAMQTATFEKHEMRPWHVTARAAIAKATGE